MNKSKKKIQTLTLAAFFVAIEILMAVTPIGYIPVGAINITTMHLPVILSGIILGPVIGALTGFVFGLTSLIKNTTAPSLLSFAFSPFIPMPGLSEGSILSLIICFVPRILVGITPYYTVKGIELIAKKAAGKQNRAIHSVATTVAAVVGAFTNTVLVMGMIYLFFKEPYAAANNIPVDTVLTVILGIVGTNGVPEAVAAAIITTPVCIALEKVAGRLKIKAG